VRTVGLIRPLLLLTTVTLFFPFSQVFIASCLAIKINDKEGTPLLAKPNGTVHLYEPVQLSFVNNSCSGNPFDAVATAKFTHCDNVEQVQTELFYDGRNIWRLRFTGTRPGLWHFVTTSDNAQLDGLSGDIKVLPKASGPGFITHFGNKWARTGTNRAFVPQYVMYARPQYFYNNPKRIEADIKTFFVEHGFNGFHTWVACRWFNLDKDRSNEISKPDPNPDRRTFEALELLIRKVYLAGGVVHIWSWGDEQRHMTPVRWGINGKIDQRLQRYICARLGPLPGWSMGYGWDLQEWVTAVDLQKWHNYMHKHLGWFHFLGGRSPKLTQIYPGLDYASYQQHRPDYELYRKGVVQYPEKPAFFEDRFRVRKNGYPKKDYDFAMTRRGLWHSTMAGGAANIWGNLLNPRADGMSHPYPNNQQILTWSRFWKDRFNKQLIPQNDLTDGLCLKAPGSLLIFYKEDTDRIRMNLKQLCTLVQAVAVDTQRAYSEIPISGLKAQSGQVFNAGWQSDWVVAVKGGLKQ